ncbi:MAG TPA: alanine:cation symporter family protein [Clostridiaceae bacterium]|nr:alanine:cation symporter family protein [Clostridiaceae bacterium]
MLLNFLNWLNGLLWSTPMLVLILGGGLLFTFRMKFVQFTKLPDMFRLTFKGDSGVTKDKNAKGITTVQALSMTIASAIGVGNIAGVATAITLGGPGAVFWMWITALVGAGTAVVECTLGQIYKDDIGGEYRGGPAYYLEKATGQRWLGVAFAISTLIAYGWALYTPQTHSIALSMEEGFGIPPIATGIIVCVLFAIVMFGGVKRIGEFAAIVVPIMATAYILIAIVMLVLNASKVPGVFALIFRSAFNMEAAFGGMLGSAIAMGVKRGIYSNEAGQGTSPHGAAASRVSHPIRQGLIQSFCVYIDTILVCTATALMILITDSYNVVNPAGEILVNNIGDVTAGALNTQMALNTLAPGFGAKFVAIAVGFFAFTSCIAPAYYGESNLIYIMKRRSEKSLIVLRLVIMSGMFFGAVRTSDVVWALTDMGLGLMAWVNILGLLFINGIAIRTYNDYMDQTREGIANPVFDPVKLKIPRAHYWENRLKSKVESVSTEQTLS